MYLMLFIKRAIINRKLNERRLQACKYGGYEILTLK